MTYTLDTYILDMVAIMNYTFFTDGRPVTYILDTYILDIVAIMNYNCVLPEDIAHAQLPESVTHYQKMGNMITINVMCNGLCLC